jgi:hypothetical protein
VLLAVPFHPLEGNSMLCHYNSIQQKIENPKTAAVDGAGSVQAVCPPQNIFPATTYTRPNR